MKKQIDEILMVIDDNACANISEDECDSKDSCAICRAERIYNAGYRKQREGEWKPSPSGSTNVYCSLCGAMSGGGIYCSHCGAKMKGGAE